MQTQTHFWLTILGQIQKQHLWKQNFLHFEKPNLQHKTKKILSFWAK